MQASTEKHAGGKDKAPSPESVLVQKLIQEASANMTGRPGVIQSFVQYVRETHPKAYQGFVKGLVAEARERT